MPHSPTVKLARELIRRVSVTPDDAGCQEVIADQLSRCGFQCEQINREDVTNLWATHGNGKPLVVFAGHTDVVPTGPLDQWTHDPFEGVISEGMLHGRGSADMKGSIASFLTACERFAGRHGNHIGTIGLLITSDEEGIARWGTRAVLDELNQRNIDIDMCIVGEPTSVERLGDMAKIGRRGTVGGKLIIHGKQGHIAYPQLALNPIHAALPALRELVERQWDRGNDNFLPTSFQFSNIHGGTGAANVIPGMLELDFNFRYSPVSTHTALMQQTEKILEDNSLSFDIDWGEPGLPYETVRGVLVETVQAAVEEVTGNTPEFTTTGGTSDGRYIAPTGAQVVELGPVNATIHQINEQVSIDDLDSLSRAYEKILELLLAS
jgi:succinyl-diaminopimelate desuccinylase